MSIFNFLSENLFFVVIVIAAMASLFRRLKRSGENPDHKMPSFGGGSYERQHDPGRLSEPMSSSNESVGQNVETGYPERRYEFTDTNMVSLRSETAAANFTNSAPPRREKAIHASGALRDGSSNPILSLRRVEKQDLIAGVMWAEVLGKPRAKKPYLPPRYRE